MNFHENFLVDGKSRTRMRQKIKKKRKWIALFIRPNTTSIVFFMLTAYLSNCDILWLRISYFIYLLFLSLFIKHLILRFRVHIHTHTHTQQYIWKTWTICHLLYCNWLKIDLSECITRKISSFYSAYDIIKVCVDNNICGHFYYNLSCIWHLSNYMHDMYYMQYYIQQLSNLSTATWNKCRSDF